MDWCILNVAIDSIPVYVLKTDIFNQSFVFLLLQDLQFDISQAKMYFSSFSKIVIHVYTGMFIHVRYMWKKKIRLSLNYFWKTGTLHTSVFGYFNQLL